MGRQTCTGRSCAAWCRPQWRRPTRARRPAAAPWAPPRPPVPALPPDQAPPGDKNVKAAAALAKCSGTNKESRPVSSHLTPDGAEQNPCHYQATNTALVRKLCRQQSDTTFLSLMGALVSIIWQAVCRPIKRGRRCVPPKPGRMPSCSSGRPSFVPAPQHFLLAICHTPCGPCMEGPAPCLSPNVLAATHHRHLVHPRMSPGGGIGTQRGHSRVLHERAGTQQGAPGSRGGGMGT